MLRALKNAFNSPRLIGFSATSIGGFTCSVLAGVDDAASAACDAAGRAYITLADVFARPPVVVGSPNYFNVGAQGAVLIEADPTISLLSLRTNSGSGGDNGTLYALALGWDSEDTGYHADGIAQGAPHTVKDSISAPRYEVFKVTPDASTPVINIGSSKATLTKQGPGDYTINFKRPFSNDDVVAVAGVISGTAAHHHIATATATGVRVCVGAGGSLSDSLPFYVVVRGSDNPINSGRHRKTARISDRLPRVVGGHVQYSGGTPSINIGSGDFTITDTGTGVLTVTWARPCAREPIIVASKDAQGLVTLNAAASTTGCVINCFDGSGVAADPADLHFLAFMFDDAEEYAFQ